MTEHGIRRCRIKLKSEGIGKLKPCQTIFIKLYNYPYMEFGELKTILPYEEHNKGHMDDNTILALKKFISSLVSFPDLG